jgi:iron complex outermembrane recepter protein
MSKVRRFSLSVSVVALALGATSAQAAVSADQAQATTDQQTNTPQPTAPSLPVDAPQANPDNTPPVTDSNAQSADVVVTGTRVVRNGYLAPTPTTVVGADTLQQREPMTVVDALATLPSFRATSTPSTGSQAVAGTLGASFLNLRGLGSNRTLVLLDGERLVPSTTQGLVDVSIIPSFIIKRVDVVTGGASASWGSDAVAGVANFVLDHDFTGFKWDVSSGVTQYGDGGNVTANAVVGKKFLNDRLHVIVGGEYYHNNGVPPQARQQNQGDYGLIANPAYTPTNGQPQRLLEGNLYYASPFNAMVASGVAKGTLFNADGTLSNQKFQFCTAAQVPDRLEPCNTVETDRSFLTQWTVLSSPQTRTSGYGRISYDLSSNLSVYVDALYGRTQTRINAGGPPISWLQPLGTYYVPLDSAFVPDALRAELAAAGETKVVISKTFNEIPPAFVTQTNTTKRVTAGIDGTVFKNWKFTSHYEHGESIGDFYQQGISIIPKMLQAWDAVVGPNGTLMCRSTLTDPNNGCVPSNPFSSAPKSAQETAYYLGNPQSRLVTIEDSAAVNLTGEPFNTWAGPVSLAVGAEWRKDTARQTVDPISAAKGFALSNPQPIYGSLNAKEIYGELVIPLAKDMPLLRNLDVDVAGRHTDYSYSGTVNTWKGGVNYRPFDDLRFRVTRSRDIRAPNILEIFNTGTQSFGSVTDPQAGGTVGFQATLNVGNPGLKPEIADTFSYGLVYQPHWFPSFSFSVDAYKIHVKDAITTLALQNIVDQCADGDTELCDLITRNQAGAITNIKSETLNLATFDTKGIDFEASYDLRMSSFNANWGGDIQFRALVNYVSEFTTNNGVTTIDEAGSILNNQPKWKGSFNATYLNGPNHFFVNVDYTGSGTYDNQYVEGVTIDDNSIASNTVVSIGASRDIVMANRLVNFYINVDNLFNQGPPEEFPVNGGNYDRLGRRFLVGVRGKF